MRSNWRVVALLLLIAALAGCSKKDGAKVVAAKAPVAIDSRVKAAEAKMAGRASGA